MNAEELKDCKLCAFSTKNGTECSVVSKLCADIKCPVGYQNPLIAEIISKEGNPVPVKGYWGYRTKKEGL